MIRQIGVIAIVGHVDESSRSRHRKALEFVVPSYLGWAFRQTGCVQPELLMNHKITVASRDVWIKKKNEQSVMKQTFPQGGQVKRVSHLTLQLR
jgi:hypothetical protein